MARISWDGGYTAYLADVIVHPEYQRFHIGNQMVKNIIDDLQSQMEPGDGILLSLGAAEKKEPFLFKNRFSKSAK